MATTPKKALTPKQQAEREIRKEISKQKKRIRQQIRRIEKRGYTVPANIIPPMPKHPTEKTLSRLQKITSDYLYKKAVYTSPEGVTMKGTERRKMERSEAAKRAAETRRQFYEKVKTPEEAGSPPPPPAPEPEPQTGYEWYGPEESFVVYWRIQDQIEEWTPSPFWSRELTQFKEHDHQRLKNIFNDAIIKEGWKTVARRIQDNALDIQDIVDRVLYSSGSAYRDTGREGINQDLNRFSSILNNRPLTVQESAEFTEFGEIVGE